MRYHLRGFRYAESLWQPFRFALAEWLYGWEPPEKRLVIVGPSGGWCTQPLFFERFTEVIGLEPDPIAHVVFRRRLARAPLETRPSVRFLTEDHLLDDPERLPRLVEQEGDVAILFSNVLGQLRVLTGAGAPDDPRLVRIRTAIARAIEGRSWASFHDRLSGLVAPELDPMVLTDVRLDDAAIVRRFYPSLMDASEPIGEAAELLDHMTEGFFPPERPHAYFSWPLMPGVFHLIEATRGIRDQ
ncbi:MAG TPA: hypothetical protein VFV94_12305 [Polyangiaceae bacterium]|nr:hypothetical protein [Polyangiaceae bacterium]